MFADKKLVNLILKDVGEWNRLRQEQREGKDSKAKISYLFDRNLIGADFSGKNLKGVDFEGMNLASANLRNTDLENANLKHTKLNGAELQGTNFNNADLECADLLGAKFNDKTKFSGATVNNCAVDRNAFDFLDDFGGLTMGDRMTMYIRDDVALLRNKYSGFWQWLHLAALFVFLFPYLYFIAEQWASASFHSMTPLNSMPLWQALWRFIYNGGVNWQGGSNFHWSFLIFIFTLLYNILRMCLLIKTKSIELAQESTGLPVRFSLRDRIFSKLSWKTLFDWSKFCFYFNPIVIGINTLHFFFMDIPLDSKG